jgi:hypothetical protein
MRYWHRRYVGSGVQQVGAMMVMDLVADGEVLHIWAREDEALVHEEGSAFVHAFSVQCPEGEWGRMAIELGVTPITERCFELARERGWTPAGPGTGNLADWEPA